MKKTLELEIESYISWFPKILVQADPTTLNLKVKLTIPVSWYSTVD
jgi:hypothetical protein